MASLGVHWFRNGPSGSGRPSPAHVQNNRVLAWPSRPASLWERAGQRAVRYSQMDVSLRHWARLHLPDVSRVFCDRPVTRELSRARYIQDGFLCPSILIGIQFTEVLMRLDVGRQVRQVHVVIPVRQQRVTQWSENTGFIAAEMIGKDQIQRSEGLRLVFIVPKRVVPGAAGGHLSPWE